MGGFSNILQANRGLLTLRLTIYLITASSELGVNLLGCPIPCNICQ